MAAGGSFARKPGRMRGASKTSVVSRSLYFVSLCTKQRS